MLNDPHIPLLLWWALEDKAVSDRERVLQLFDSPAAWQNPLAPEVHRGATEPPLHGGGERGGSADLYSAARRGAGPAETDLVIRGMDQALAGRHQPRSPELASQSADLWSTSGAEPYASPSWLTPGHPQAYERALQVIADSKAPAGKRIVLHRVLGQIGKSECVPTLWKLLADSEPGSPHGGAVSPAALPGPDHRRRRCWPLSADAAHPTWPSANLAVQQAGIGASVSRVRWTGAGSIPRKFPSIKCAASCCTTTGIHQLVEKHWGKIGQETAGEHGHGSTASNICSELAPAT